MQLGLFLVLRGWRSFLPSTYPTVYKELDREMTNLRKISATLPWFTEMYKKKLPYIFQATNEVMFLS